MVCALFREPAITKVAQVRREWRGRSEPNGQIGDRSLGTFETILRCFFGHKLDFQADIKISKQQAQTFSQGS